LEPFARAAEEGRLALHLGTLRVVEGWLDIYAAGLAQRSSSNNNGGPSPDQPVDAAALAFGWGTNEYMRSRGGYGVTLECGQHDDPAAPGVAHAAIHAALRLLGMVAPAGSAEPPRPELLRLVSVTDRAHAQDRFVREWATFDAVAAGQPIARRADGTVLAAERDGFIVFPNPEALAGTEWFYFAVASDRRL
ncbi:MAG: succinylglutamate desuccinylase, partial [Comamonadaceae bacterium]